ncbi:MAG: hypothetical protein HUJ76_04290 [Parasporobacterium sp.]|nr:hypothetical protein [Parasporobacterium sp.]
MRNFFENLSYKFQGLMRDRYGVDQLSKTLNIAALVFIILSLFGPLGFFRYIALAVLIWSLVRSFSKNKAARVRELEAYLRITKSVTDKFNLVKRMIKERNTHLYCKCPNCKAMVRISKPPKGKTIRINCPKCKNSFEKRT